MTPEQIRAACDESPNGCWEKRGTKPNRYGAFRGGGQHRRAHRVSWEAHNGPIPKGLYVCHRCNNKRCANPAHLYVATHRQNAIDTGRDGLLGKSHRAVGITLENKLKTHCKRGHAFDGSNIMTDRHGHRRCRECQQRNGRAFVQRKREIARLDKEAG